MLTVSARLTRGAFTLDAAFGAEADGVVALFGASGAGKTTLADAIAGLVRPEAGRIVLEDRVLFDSEAGIDLRPERRRIGYVFQDGRLFPHLSVRGNLLYGHRFAPREGRYATLERIVTLLGLEALLHRRPGTLSGGERQRVALGRALMAQPELLLMDEPLAALDVPRKAQVIDYIERLRDEIGVPIVFVSHAVDEVARLAGTIVVMAGGRSRRRARPPKSWHGSTSTRSPGSRPPARCWTRPCSATTRPMDSPNWRCRAASSACRGLGLYRGGSSESACGRGTCR